MKQQAILILTSGSTRHTGLPSATWTKLFQAGDCYLDLSYQQGLLIGQVLHKGGVSFTSARAALLDPQGTPIQTTQLTPKAGFRLAVGDLNAHRLELTLDQSTFDVALS